MKHFETITKSVKLFKDLTDEEMKPFLEVMSYYIHPEKINANEEIM